jgi:flagellar secretion chaperone FliS
VNLTDSKRPTLSPSCMLAAQYGVSTAVSSPELVIMLYEVILRCVAEADEALIKQEFESLRDRVGRALAVIDELTLTFEPRHSAHLAEGLLALYQFCRRRLLEANQWRDRQALADVRLAFAPLYDAWVVAAAA